MATKTPTQKQNAQQKLPDGSTVSAKIDQTVQNDPDAIAKIKKSILVNRMGPTTKQSASFVDWAALAETLGQPFDAELVPFSKLRQMRRDPMISFGLHYVKTPLVRAPWKIKCADPQVAAFMDAALRPIYARLIFQMCLSMDFGFSAISKEFKLDTPTATYIDDTGNDKPVWSEGNVQAVMWKPFKALPPEKVKPAWDAKTGEFNGIVFQGEDESGSSGAGAGLSSSGSSGSGQEDKPTIDVYHALWASNEKDSVFGSLWGYPRIAYAYRYWWSYWFRWALSDRAFERNAVPPIVGYHPEGVYEDDEGLQYDNMDVMLDGLSAMRSGGVVALPSDVYIGDNGAAGTVREWELKYLDGGNTSWDFDKSFNYLDVMKLRSLWVPEQAFIEGEGGTSSRNVASQMAEIFIQSQTNLMAEIDDQINNYLIPQLLVINFPEFVGECIKETTGFSSDDIDFMKQIIQLVGQQSQDPAAALGINLREAMNRVGLPVLSPAEAAQQQSQLVANSATSTPALTAPTNTAAGVVSTPQTTTGFSYVAPTETINLSDDAEFLTRLPNSPHFNLKDAKSSAVLLQSSWAQYMHHNYTGFAKYIEGLDSVEFADGELSASQKAGIAAGGLITAAAAKKLADRIVSAWEGPAQGLKTVSEATAKALGLVLASAATTEADRAGYEVSLDKEQVSEWSNERLGHLLATTDKTVRGELTDVLAKEIESGAEPKAIANKVREHFDGFPQWKADRIARTEAQTAYNVGTVFAARSVGAKQVLAHDASDGTDLETDEECKDRDGNIYKLSDALRENEDEHPNGTLYFTIVPSETTVTVLEASDDVDMQGTLAFFDNEESTVYFSDELDREQRAAYMFALVDTLRDKNVD